MKMKTLMRTAALFVAIATFTVTSSNALTSKQVQEIRKSVLAVPVPEMPAKAADLVKSAQQKDRQAVAVTAVRAVVQKHRAAAPLVIAAVSKVAPDLASVVAVAAAEIVTEQAAQIARAAAAAAPAHAEQISTAVARVTPAQTPVGGTTASPAVSSVPTIAAAVPPAVNVRESAHEPSTGGTIIISGTPINTEAGGVNGNFPLQAPVPATATTVLYNTPPTD